MNTWLVEYGGEVLLIRRSREYGFQEGTYWCCEHGVHTTKFVVYKTNITMLKRSGSKGKTWVIMHCSLDVRNQTFSVLASSSSSSVDVAGGIRRNHIYTSPMILITQTQILVGLGKPRRVTREFMICESPK